MSGMNQDKFVVVTLTKSIGISILLTLLFGPLGMLYSTIPGAIIMGIITLVVGIPTLGFGLIFTWPICLIWAAVAAKSYNNRVLRQRNTSVESKSNNTFNSRVPITPEPITEEFVTESFDLVKWNALLKYDDDIASAFERLKPLGQKWLDEFASSYLTLNDKQYLPEIEHKITIAAESKKEKKEQEAIAAAKAKAERDERFRVRAEEQKKADEEQKKAYLQEQERRSQARNEQFELWRDRLTGNRKVLILTSVSIVFLIAISVVIVWLWQSNLKLKEDELRLAEEHSRDDESNRRLEEEQAKELARISEMEKRLAEEHAKLDETRRRSEIEQSGISKTPSSTATMTSVPIPPIQIGDSYVYEYIDIDQPESRNSSKRTVTSNGDKIVLSAINIDNVNAKKRSLYFNHEWNLISTRNADNSGFDYSPPLKYFDFPLYPGKTWQQTTTETNIKTGATRTHKISGTIGQWEDVSVPAGVFHAIKIVLQTELFDPTTAETLNGTDTSWYVPEIRRSVKSLTTGKNGKKQLIQLISYEVK